MYDSSWSSEGPWGYQQLIPGFRLVGYFFTSWFVLSHCLIYLEVALDHQYPLMNIPSNVGEACFLQKFVILLCNH